MTQKKLNEYELFVKLTLIHNFSYQKNFHPKNRVFDFLNYFPSSPTNERFLYSDYKLVNPQQCMKNLKSAFENKIFLKSRCNLFRSYFSKISLLIKGVKIKLRLRPENIQSIQLYTFPKIDFMFFSLRIDHPPA